MVFFTLSEKIRPSNCFQMLLQTCGAYSPRSFYCWSVPRLELRGQVSYSLSQMLGDRGFRIRTMITILFYSSNSHLISLYFFRI